MRRVELLIPAGSLDILRTAVMYGADAVYLGGEAFGLRAKAKNFTGEEIRQGIAYAHDHGVRVYVTANILAHNEDLDKAREYFQELREYGPDALIISDPGIFSIARQEAPARIRNTHGAMDKAFNLHLLWDPFPNLPNFL